MQPRSTWRGFRRGETPLTSTSAVIPSTEIAPTGYTVEDAIRIEVVFLAAYRSGRILRMTELTWPDWSRLGAFDTYPG